MKNKYIILWFGLVFCASVVLDSFVIGNLWEWYFVPLGLKSLAFKQAMGLRIFLGFVTYQFYSFKRDEDLEIVNAIYYLFYRPIIALTLGWVVHLI